MDEQMRIEVLGLAGSPRRGGNTDVLLDAFLMGREKRGLIRVCYRLHRCRLRRAMTVMAAHEMVSVLSRMIFKPLLNGLSLLM